MNLHELGSTIFFRAVVLSIEKRIDLDEAKKLAAKEVAASAKVELAKAKEAASLPTTYASAHDDLSNELTHAKERLFARLHNYFRRFDARRGAEKKARLAAKRAAKKQSLPRVKLRNPAPPVPQPALPSDNNLVHFPLVYTGTERSAQHIDDADFLPRYRDRITANWRELIAQQERKKQS